MAKYAMARIEAPRLESFIKIVTSQYRPQLNEHEVTVAFCANQPEKLKLPSQQELTARVQQLFVTLSGYDSPYIESLFDPFNVLAQTLDGYRQEENWIGEQTHPLVVVGSYFWVIKFESSSNFLNQN